MSSRSRRLSIVLSAAAAALLLAAGIALHHERERRHLEAVVVEGRPDQITRIAWQSETSHGKAGGEDEIGHLVEPTNAASACFRRHPKGRSPAGG